MSQIHLITEHSQIQTNHVPWKTQTFLFKGWNQNPKKGKTSFGYQTLS